MFYLILAAGATSAISLALGGTIIEPPKPAPNTKEVFVKIKDAYEIHEKVITHLTDNVGVKDLQEFVDLFQLPDEIPKFINDVGLEKGLISLQVARLRRAHKAIKKGIEEKEAREAKCGRDDDPEAPLPKDDLEKARAEFWRRYKLSLPSDAVPSDQLLSKVLRESMNRLFTAQPIWKVADMAGPTQANPDARSLFVYLAKLRVYVTALAIAGSRACDEVPSDAEAPTTVAAKYVHAPFDTLLRYLYRAEKRAHRIAAINPKFALQWLSERDEEERTAWVDSLRSSSMRVGEIVAKSLVERENLWTVPKDIPQVKGETSSAAATKDSGWKSQSSWGQYGQKRQYGGNQYQQQAKRGRPDDSDIKTKPTLASGEPICPDFNKGTCTSTPCAKGLHVCNVLCKRDRACGMKNHCALRCENKLRV